MKKSLFLAAALLLAGCGGPDAQKTSDKDIQVLESTISYFKDSRTDLCFATISSYSYGGVHQTLFTNVPCNEKVLSLIR